MSAWWFIWRGWVFYGVAILGAVSAGMFGVIAAMAHDYQVVFWAFVACVLSGVLAGIAGAFAATFSLTARERRWWRAEFERQAMNPPGVPTHTRARITPVNGAHSAGEEGYSNG